jgi:hypothetical protein
VDLFAFHRHRDVFFYCNFDLCVTFQSSGFQKLQMGLAAPKETAKRYMPAPD